MKIGKSLKLLLIVCLCSVFLCTKNISAQTIFKAKDKEIFEQVIETLQGKENLPTADLIVEVGKLLLETPYVAHTLESNKERLTINLRELDCTTYAENCLAVVKTIQSKNPSFENFCLYIQEIRYRNGKLDQYPSRLHYFSDWIYNNEEKGLVTDASKKIANIPYRNKVNFMSEHPKSYKQIKENADFLSEIREQEKIISGRSYFYIPKDKVESFEHKLKEGDIIGITTSIEGLDITHVGILVKKNDRMHLMHASSKAEKVIISDNTLSEYLMGRKSSSGIMVARPN